MPLLLLLFAVSLAACQATAPAAPPAAEPTATVKPAAAEASPAPTTVAAAAYAVVEPPTLDKVLPAPAGLVYRNEEGVWYAQADGQTRLLTDQVDAVPAPDLAHAYRWDYDNTLYVMDLASGEETSVTPDGQLSGMFNWANEETILLGLWLSPEEGDGPNNGHLASLDIASGVMTVLDPDRLMSSAPAMSPDSQAIAFSSAGPLLYTPENGVTTFPADSFGLADIQVHLSPAWSPDGQRLAWIVGGGPFGDNPEATMGLAVYDLAANTVSLDLAFDPARWGATPPAAVWSPDGRWLALRVYANGPDGSGIWVLSAESDGGFYIPGISGNANYPLWSAEGDRLLYFDAADEDEAPYAQRLIFDPETGTTTPIALENGLGLLWLDGGAVAEPADALCQSVPRPALLLVDRGDYVISNPVGGETCAFAFPGQFPGLIQSGGDSLYYHELDATTQRAVVMRLAADGLVSALPFTAAEPPAQLLHYIVSPDGRRIAWSVSRPDATGQVVSDLWLAETSGAEPLQLVDGWPAGDNRLLVPLRFSSDGQTIYFALQPNGVGGSWVAFSGRHDNLHSLPTTGGQAQELFQCPAGNLLCLGDFSGDGVNLQLAYSDPASKSIIVLGAGGETISQFTYPEADFLGYPSFSPGGQLAFYTAIIAEHADGYPVPLPGTIYLVEGDQARALKSGDSVATLIGWLDGQRLVYNTIDAGGNWSTAVTGLSGETWIWGAGPTQFITILR